MGKRLGGKAVMGSTPIWATETWQQRQPEMPNMFQLKALTKSHLNPHIMQSATIN